MANVDEAFKDLSIDDAEADTQNERQSQRGRKAKVPLSVQLEEYISVKQQLLGSDNKLKSKKSPIFLSIGNKLGMTQGHVHLNISRNMQQIFGSDYAENTTKKPVAQDEEDEEDTLEWNYRDVDGTTIRVQLDDNQKRQFDIVTVQGKTRLYRTLKNGWTDEVAKIIECSGIDCVVTFKNVKLDGTEFNCTALCAECKGSVYVESRNNRNELLMHVKNGPHPHTHTKFRRMTKVKADTIRLALQNKSVHELYTSQAENIPSDAENLPRSFVSQKSIENTRRITKKNEPSTLLMLRQMKYDPKFDGAIKEIVSDPFCVLFWSKEQQYYYGQIKNPCISVDATGGLIKTTNILSDINSNLTTKVRLPHVFLHLISVKNDGVNSVPVGQMLSSQQDSDRISYFFKRWSRDFARPEEVVMDDSAAYLKSSAESFAKCNDIKEYIAKCFDALAGKCVFSGPLIRLDSAHLIRNLYKVPQLKKMIFKVKQLYLSAIGFIMQCEDFQAVCNVIEHITILANIPFNVDSSKCKFDPAESVNKLKKLVTSHEIEIMFEEKDVDSYISDANEEGDYEDDNDKTNSFFDEILQKVTADLDPKTHVTSDDVYCKPEINPYLRKLFNRLPLWSAVVKKFTKSNQILPTSNDTESRFNVIKNVVFDKLPTEPHIFVDQMLTEVNALSKLTGLIIKHKMNCIKFKDVKEKNSVSDHISNNRKCKENESDEELHDNWMGLGKPKQKQTKHRQVHFILNKQVSEKIHFLKIALLDNGHFTKTKRSIYVTSTYSVDVVFHILFCAMADFPELKEHVLQNADQDFVKFTQSYFKNGAVQSTYLARNVLLLKAFELQIEKQLKSLNCESTVVCAVDKVFKTSVENIFAEHSCHCNENNGNTVLQIDLSGIRNLVERSLVCTNCGTNGTIKANEIMFVDGKNALMKCAEIPEALMINDKIYCLLAIVEKRNEHYVVNIKRCNEKWYLFDCNQPEVTQSNLKRELIVHMSCYVSIKSNVEPFATIYVKK